MSLTLLVDTARVSGMEIVLPQEVQRVVGAIAATGARPLLVGGCVRDAFLGLQSKDIDIEVHGDVSIEVLTTTLATLFKVDAVGKAFGVLKVRAGKTDVDVSLPRRDSKTGDSHTSFTVEVDQTMTVAEAASRRDFTINSIMYNPLTRAVIDPWGGVQDLEGKVLRHTSAAFAEDPLRVLRLVQFVARFGFDVAPETLEMCHSLVDQYDTISKERIWMEFSKIGEKGRFIQKAMKVLIRSGWGIHFPEITEQTKGSQQLREYSGMDKMELTIASIAFDTSSPLTFLQRIDAPLAIQKMAQRFVSSRSVRDCKRCYGHSMARFLAPWTIRQFSLVTDTVGVWADGQKVGVCDGPRPLLVTGQDLIDHGMTPGPEFKPLLEKATKLQDCDGMTKEEILVQLFE